MVPSAVQLRAASLRGAAMAAAPSLAKARLGEDGLLTLQGRSDTAIKVRGYLVDISEIEDALRSAAKAAAAAKPAEA